MKIEKYRKQIGTRYGHLFSMNVMVGQNEIDGESYLTVNNPAMTYMLINAVEEQQSEIGKQCNLTQKDILSSK